MRHVVPPSTAPETVVLVHCSASSGRQWRALTEQLGGRFRALPIDLYGHGGNRGWAGDGPLTLADEAAAIGRATSGQDAPFHLIGHSYGGGVALRFALEHADRLASLTLIEPSAFHLLKQAGCGAGLINEVRGIADMLNACVTCGDYRAGMARFIDYWGGAGSWDDLAEEKRAQFAGLAVHIAHHFHALIEEPTPLAAYARIVAPTLILCGNRSPRPSRAITRLLADVMPNARHRTVDDGNHMAAIQRPDKVNPPVLQHLLAAAPLRIQASVTGD